MTRLLRVVLAAIPALMLTFAVPLVNRIDPRIFGFPFLLGWILAWVVITPIIMLAVERLRIKA